MKLGKAEYLDAPSMPDLFHFNQGIAQSVGALIGRIWKKALTEYKQTKGNDCQTAALEQEWLLVDSCRTAYQNDMHAIHKAIHAFDGSGNLKSADAINLEIICAIRSIEQQATTLASTIPDKTLIKTVEQIPDIIQGVKTWQEWFVDRVDCFVKTFSFSQQDLFKQWLVQCLIPFAYWTEIHRRTPGKKRNKRLRHFYQELIEQAKVKLDGHPLISLLTKQELEICWAWTLKTVATFQRSSSQVEGRNGYLAFIHKANRGLSEQRLKVLTVVHNFDTRRIDGTTPAQRLFNHEFPDLFEFILQNVTPFPEPRVSRKKQAVLPFVAP